MPTKHPEILAQLRKQLLSLQGITSPPGEMPVKIGCQPIEEAFPEQSFPVAALHEFISGSAEELAATGGFVTALLSAFMKNRGAAVWIYSSLKIYPPALRQFGIEPDRILFVRATRKLDGLWAAEEALKYDGLAAVVAEIPELDFTQSRRLQLVIKQSRVSGFILRHNSKKLSTTASVSRWKITPLPSSLEEGMPGIGFPKWNVELTRVQNGRAGTWPMEWADRHFNIITPAPANVEELIQKKVG